MARYITFLAILIQTTLVAQSSITVSIPNGGESWARGFSYLITWDDTFEENVKIELYKGDEFHSVIVGSTESDGRRNWRIDSSIPSGSDYKIKISNVDDAAVFDFSDDDFTIGSFELTVPNGGESWSAGTFHQIKFNTILTDLDTVVDFELWKGGALDRLLFENTDADGSKDWNIPIDLTPGSDYKIKIFHHNDPTDFDFSDADFTITPFVPSIDLTAPNGGENWRAGTVELIKWTDNIAEDVRIELYKGGILNSTIINSTDSDGSKIWEIPPEVPPGSDYKVKIVSVVDNSVFDISDTDFIILDYIPTITITVPNGGENWQKGTQATITWTDNLTENVKIDLYENDLFHSELFASTFSDGSKFWTIPEETVSGSDYKIKISSVNDANIFDISDANFSILTASDINIDPTPFVFNVLIDGSDTDVMTIYNTAPAESQNLIWDIIEQESILSSNSEFEIPITLKKSQEELSSQMRSNDNELQRNLNNNFNTSSKAANSSWLSESPVNGSIAPGDSQNVEIMVDATGLAAGTYNSNLLINSNDPDESQLIIPVELNVLLPPIVNEIGIITNVDDKSIHILDVQTNTITGPYLAGQLGTGFLLDAVVTPDAQMALVSNLQGNSVYFIDLSIPNSPSVISSINVGFRAEDIALTNDGAYAIVSTDYQSLSNLAVIDVVNRSLIQSINISPRNAQAVEIGSDGTVLIADFYNSRIHTMLLNLSSGALTDLNSFIDVGIEPINISISPNGQTAIVANFGGNSLSILRINSPGNVSLSQTITGMNNPQSIAFDHSGQRTFVVQSGNSPDQIAVLNVLSPENVNDTGIRISLLSDGTSGYLGVDVIGISSDNQYAYVGNPSEGLTSNSISIVDLNNYTLSGSLLCGTYPLSVSLPNLTTEMHTISGILSYDNSSSTGIFDAGVDLLQNSNIIAGTVTDTDGGYLFTNVSNGTYNLETFSNIEWGGVNSTDALLIRRHIVLLETLTGLRLLAADVNASGTITSTDALLIRQRVVSLINEFPSGDWLFEEPEIIVNGSDVIEDYQGICFGDVNGSYVPSVLLKSAPNIFSSNDNEYELNKNGTGELVIKVLNNIKISALTLIFHYPKKLIKIEGIQSKLEGLLYRANNGVLKIAWDNINPESFKYKEPLITVKIKLEKTKNKKDITFSLDPMSELADEEANVLKGIKLNIPKIKNSHPVAYTLSANYPNPFNPSTIIEYSLPEQARVRIEIINALGERVSVLVDEQKEAGNYRIKWNASDLPSGLYFYRYLAQGNKKTISQVRKMILIK